MEQAPRRTRCILDGQCSLCLLVACVALLLLAGTQANTHHRRPSIPYCERIVGKLSEKELDHLRDLTQIKQHNMRIEFETSQVLHNQRKPEHDIDPNDPNRNLTKIWEFAWKIPDGQTVPEWEQRRDTAAALVRQMSDELDREIQRLVTADLLAPGTNQQQISNCAMRKINVHLYHDLPNVTFMLQYYKRPWAISRIVEQTKACDKVFPSELVVNVDSAEEHKEWAELSYSSKGFVIPFFSKGIHETRAFNRMAHLGRGKVLIAMHDDHILPGDCSWLKDVVQMFDDNPSLGAVGFGDYRYSHALNEHEQKEVYFKNPKTGQAQQFVLLANMGPMAIRRAALLELGGFDESMQEAGECGYFTDWDLSARLWLTGWQVMHRKLAGLDLDKQERLQKNRSCTAVQVRLATQAYWERWGAPEEEVVVGLGNLVKDANLQQLVPLDPTTFAQRCPMGMGCTVAAGGSGAAGGAGGAAGAAAGRRT